MPRPTTALIVDDEAHVRTFVRLLLKELGIDTCWEASDGQAALEFVRQYEVELVVMDINMPLLDGLQALAKMREEKLDLPVIFMTSQGAVGMVHEAMRLGAIGYVIKHVPREEALKSIREAVDSLEDEDGPAA
jgi:two-component system, chemotaxis family, chemotaxis protein CheY